jgi:hypothetical protein
VRSSNIESFLTWNFPTCNWFEYKDIECLFYHLCWRNVIFPNGVFKSHGKVWWW